MNILFEYTDGCLDRLTVMPVDNELDFAAANEEDGIFVTLPPTQVKALHKALGKWLEEQENIT